MTYELDESGNRMPAEPTESNTDVSDIDLKFPRTKHINEYGNSSNVVVNLGPNNAKPSLERSGKASEKGDNTTLQKHNMSHVVKDPDGKINVGSEEETDLEGEWSEDEEDDVTSTSNYVAKSVLYMRAFASWANQTGKKLTRGHFTFLLFVAAFFVYIGFAFSYKFGDESSKRLLVCTIIGLIVALRHKICQVYRWIFKALVGSDKLSPTGRKSFDKIRFVLRWCMYFVLLGAIGWILVDVARENPGNLRSLSGLPVFILVALFMCEKPSMIKWHTIYWCVGLQLVSAFIVLRWAEGRDGVLWVQERLDEFFAKSHYGSVQIFGEKYTDHIILFGAMPVIFITNGVLAALYYLGAMQLLISIIGSVLNFVVETTILECMGITSSIFMEGTTAVLILRPFLKKMTKSQLFMLLTTNFSSIGGAYLASLSTIGVSLKYLIPSMVISAPATIAICKLIIPESKKGKKYHLDVSIGDEEKSRYTNILDALQMGALSVLPIFAVMVLGIYTFTTYMTWCNSTVTWFGDRVGIDNLTIEVISSYVLYPIGILMGVAPEDCRRVGMLQGYRIFTLNFLAFMKLIELKGNKDQYLSYMAATNGTGLVSHTRDDVILDGWNMTLTNGFFEHERSEAIVTYSLCGFSSLVSAAMTLAAFGKLVPNRQKWVSSVAITALIAGNLANFMTGCFAGLLID